MSAEDSSFGWWIGGRTAAAEKILAVVPDRESRANFQGALRGGIFVVVLRLLEKINGRFVFVIFQKIGSFIQTYATRCAGGVDVPEPRNILRLFVCFVRHAFFVLSSFRGGNVFSRASGAIWQMASGALALQRLRRIRIRDVLSESRVQMMDGVRAKGGGTASPRALLREAQKALINERLGRSCI